MRRRTRGGRRDFLKTHSYGEFVFDFAWARAYERVGRRYYPKLTLAAPFTPATGPRLLVRAGPGPRGAAPTGCSQNSSATPSHRASPACTRCSWTSRARAACAQRGWLLRRDCQFHWSNRGYAQLRGVPGELHRREAQEGAPRAAPRRGGRACVSRPVPVRELDEPLARSRLRTAPRHLPAPRARAVPDTGVLRRDRAHACPNR